MRYRNYPKPARQKARSAIKRNAKKGNKCATRVGKVRAHQIAKNKPMSKKTLKRTYSYLTRAKVYSNPKKPNSCGSISHDLWGGIPMQRYAARKLGKRVKVKN